LAEWSKAVSLKLI